MCVKPVCIVCVHVHRYVYFCNGLMYCHVVFRSIVAFYEESIKIKVQRILLQPIQFTADISNSLSSNVTSVPSTCIEANLGNVKVRNISSNYPLLSINVGILW